MNINSTQYETSQEVILEFLELLRNEIWQWQCLPRVVKDNTLAAKKYLKLGATSLKLPPKHLTTSNPDDDDMMHRVSLKFSKMGHPLNYAME